MRRVVVLVVLVAGCGGGEPAPQGLRCSGEGTPVVLIAGLGVDARSTWAGVRDELEDVRVCEYDRPGTGVVDAKPGRRTAAVMARELHAMLEGVDSPRVLVGASFGGFIARLEAAAHPDDVAGLVFVDALHPELDATIERILPAGEARARRAALARNGEGVSYAELLASGAEVVQAARLPDVPVTVLKHGISFEPGGEPIPALERAWTRMQRELADHVTDGKLVVATRSHHRIAEDEPGAVVAAIRDVATRASGRSPSTPSPR